MSAPSEAYSQKCSCGRVFTLPAAFKNHQNSCLTSKNELSATLARSKDILTARKAAKKASLRVNHNTSVGPSEPDDRLPEGSNSNQVRVALVL